MITYLQTAIHIILIVYQVISLLTFLTTSLSSSSLQPSFKQNPAISFRDYKNFNEEAFKKELLELDWSFVTENNDINLGFETTLCFINKTLDKHAPIKGTETTCVGIATEMKKML